MSDIAQFSHFDTAHWAKVKAARASQGLDRNTEVGKVLEGHPLAGRTLTDPETGRNYFVKLVKKDWQQGWFVRAKLVRDDIIIDCVVENHTSICPEVQRSHTTFQEMFAASI